MLKMAGADDDGCPRHARLKISLPMPKKVAQAKGKAAKGGKPGPSAKLRAVRAATKPKAAAPIKKAAKKTAAKRSAPKKKAAATKKATSAASAASKKKTKNAAASPKAAGTAQGKKKAGPAASKAPKKKAAAALPAKNQSKDKKQAAPKAKAQKAPAAKKAAAAPAAKPASRSSSRAAPAPAPVASGPSFRKRGRDAQSSEAGPGVDKAASAETAPRPIKAARPSSVHELKVAPLANNKKNNMSPMVRKVGKPVVNAIKPSSPASKRAEEERVTAAEKKAAAALNARVKAVAAAEKQKQKEEESKAAAAKASAEKIHSWPARGCAFITTKEKNPLAPHWSCTGSKPKHHSFNLSMGIHPWTEEEENALMEGMVMHGRSWSKILRDPRFAQHFHKSRNQVKLKDKERCMRLSKSNKNSNSNRSMGKTEAASRRRGMQSKKRKEKEIWTEAETKLFRLAVQKEGVGSWKRIWETQPLLQKRTVVDLKDKWRNMNKAKVPSLLKLSSKTNMPIDV